MGNSGSSSSSSGGGGGGKSKAARAARRAKRTEEKRTKASSRSQSRAAEDRHSAGGSGDPSSVSPLQPPPPQSHTRQGRNRSEEHAVARVRSGASDDHRNAASESEVCSPPPPLSSPKTLQKETSSRLGEEATERPRSAAALRGPETSESVLADEPPLGSSSDPRGPAKRAPDGGAAQPSTLQETSEDALSVPLAASHRANSDGPAMAPVTPLQHAPSPVLESAPRMQQAAAPAKKGSDTFPSGSRGGTAQPPASAPARRQPSAAPEDSSETGRQSAAEREDAGTLHTLSVNGSESSDRGATEHEAPHRPSAPAEDEEDEEDGALTSRGSSPLQLAVPSSAATALSPLQIAPAASPLATFAVTALSSAASPTSVRGGSATDGGVASSPHASGPAGQRGGSAGRAASPASALAQTGSLTATETDLNRFLPLPPPPETRGGTRLSPARATAQKQQSLRSRSVGGGLHSNGSRRDGSPLDEPAAASPHSAGAGTGDHAPPTPQDDALARMPSTPDASALAHPADRRVAHWALPAGADARPEPVTRRSSVVKNRKRPSLYAHEVCPPRPVGPTTSADEHRVRPPAADRSADAAVIAAVLTASSDVSDDELPAPPHMAASAHTHLLSPTPLPPSQHAAAKPRRGRLQLESPQRQNSGSAGGEEVDTKPLVDHTDGATSSAAPSPARLPSEEPSDGLNRSVHDPPADEDEDAEAAGRGRRRPPPPPPEDAASPTAAGPLAPHRISASDHLLAPAVTMSPALDADSPLIAAAARVGSQRAGTAGGTDSADATDKKQPAHSSLDGAGPARQTGDGNKSSSLPEESSGGSSREASSGAKKDERQAARPARLNDGENALMEDEDADEEEDVPLYSFPYSSPGTRDDAPDGNDWDAQLSARGEDAAVEDTARSEPARQGKSPLRSTSGAVKSESMPRDERSPLSLSANRTAMAGSSGAAADGVESPSSLSGGYSSGQRQPVERASIKRSSGNRSNSNSHSYNSASGGVPPLGFSSYLVDGRRRESPGTSVQSRPRSQQQQSAHEPLWKERSTPVSHAPLSGADTRRLSDSAEMNDNVRQGSAAIEDTATTATTATRDAGGDGDAAQREACRVERTRDSAEGDCDDGDGDEREEEDGNLGDEEDEGTELWDAGNSGSNGGARLHSLPNLSATGYPCHSGSISAKMLPKAPATRAEAASTGSATHSPPLTAAVPRGTPVALRAHGVRSPLSDGDGAPLGEATAGPGARVPAHSFDTPPAAAMLYRVDSTNSQQLSNTSTAPTNRAGSPEVTPTPSPLGSQTNPGGGSARGQEAYAAVAVPPASEKQSGGAVEYHLQLQQLLPRRKHWSSANPSPLTGDASSPQLAAAGKAVVGAGGGGSWAIPSALRTPRTAGSTAPSTASQAADLEEQEASEEGRGAMLSRAAAAPLRTQSPHGQLQRNSPVSLANAAAAPGALVADADNANALSIHSALDSSAFFSPLHNPSGDGSESSSGGGDSPRSTKPDRQEASGAGGAHSAVLRASAPRRRSGTNSTSHSDTFETEGKERSGEELGAAAATGPPADDGSADDGSAEDDGRPWWNRNVRGTPQQRPAGSSQLASSYRPLVPLDDDKDDDDDDDSGAGHVDGHNGSNENSTDDRGNSHSGNEDLHMLVPPNKNDGDVPAALLTDELPVPLPAKVDALARSLPQTPSSWQSASHDEVTQKTESGPDAKDAALQPPATPALFGSPLVPDEGSSPVDDGTATRQETGAEAFVDCEEEDEEEQTHERGMADHPSRENLDDSVTEGMERDTRPHSSAPARGRVSSRSSQLSPSLPAGARAVEHHRQHSRSSFGGPAHFADVLDDRDVAVHLAHAQRLLVAAEQTRRLALEEAAQEIADMYALAWERDLAAQRCASVTSTSAASRGASQARAPSPATRSALHDVSPPLTAGGGPVSAGALPTAAGQEGGLAVARVAEEEGEEDYCDNRDSRLAAAMLSSAVALSAESSAAPLPSPTAVSSSSTQAPLKGSGAAAPATATSFVEILTLVGASSPDAGNLSQTRPDVVAAVAGPWPHAAAATDAGAGAADNADDGQDGEMTLPVYRSLRVVVPPPASQHAPTALAPLGRPAEHPYASSGDRAAARRSSLSASLSAAGYSNASDNQMNIGASAGLGAPGDGELRTGDAWQGNDVNVSTSAVLDNMPSVSAPSVTTPSLLLRSLAARGGEEAAVAAGASPTAIAAGERSAPRARAMPLRSPTPDAAAAASHTGGRRTASANAADRTAETSIAAGDTAMTSSAAAGQTVCRYCGQPYRSSRVCAVDGRTHEYLRALRHEEKRAKKAAQGLLREGKVQEAVKLLASIGLVGNAESMPHGRAAVAPARADIRVLSIDREGTRARHSVTGSSTAAAAVARASHSTPRPSTQPSNSLSESREASQGTHVVHDATLQMTAMANRQRPRGTCANSPSPSPVTPQSTPRRDVVYRL